LEAVFLGALDIASSEARTTALGTLTLSFLEEVCFEGAASSSCSSLACFAFHASECLAAFLSSVLCLAFHAAECLSLYSAART